MAKREQGVAEELKEQQPAQEAEKKVQSIVQARATTNRWQSCNDQTISIPYSVLKKSLSTVCNI
ncbi:hypothetical protein NW801_04880 [Brevibacillus laterosporus]|uniref:Uncharacterized protein n=1 Tax=Brevibacillus halotolerans TaxID=1507437 RepID=A0ABT4HTQ7_9BACL|nr:MULTISPECIES: hypothetical protein [Brevibacillus]MCR8984418.1 hypothetical protein [Brevibacillus laterosporus]MCZ0830142.1 hypothetical protein [Brevibacillus halotolerans]